MASSTACKLYTIKLSNLGRSDILFETNFKNMLENCIEPIIANNIDVVTKTDWKKEQKDLVKLNGFISDINIKYTELAEPDGRKHLVRRIHVNLEKGKSPKGQFQIERLNGEIIECWLVYSISTRKISLVLGSENEQGVPFPINYTIGPNPNQTGILEPVIEEIVVQIYNLLTSSGLDTEPMSEDTSDDEEWFTGYQAPLYKLPKLRW